jgi:hypothetical protein
MGVSKKRKDDQAGVDSTIQQNIGRDGTQVGSISNSHVEIGPREKKSLLAGAAALATVIAALVALLAYLNIQPEKHDGEPKKSNSSFFVTAKIVNTGTDGVYTYTQPQNGPHYSDGYLEGNDVNVVCQKRDGGPMTDRDPAPGQPTTWAVWDKLDNGRWLPDLWTDLPKNPGDTPPNDLPKC